MTPHLNAYALKQLEDLAINWNIELHRSGGKFVLSIEYADTEDPSLGREEANHTYRGVHLPTLIARAFYGEKGDDEE